MKPRAIKLTALLLTLALMCQSVAWAHPAPLGASKVNLRALAYEERDQEGPVARRQWTSFSQGFRIAQIIGAGLFLADILYFHYLGRPVMLIITAVAMFIFSVTYLSRMLNELIFEIAKLERLHDLSQLSSVTEPSGMYSDLRGVLKHNLPEAPSMGDFSEKYAEWLAELGGQRHDLDTQLRVEKFGKRVLWKMFISPKPITVPETVKAKTIYALYGYYKTEFTRCFFIQEPLLYAAIYKYWQYYRNTISLQRIMSLSAIWLGIGPMIAIYKLYQFLVSFPSVQTSVNLKVVTYITMWLVIFLSCNLVVYCMKKINSWLERRDRKFQAGISELRDRFSQDPIIAELIKGDSVVKTAKPGTVPKPTPGPSLSQV